MAEAELPALGQIFLGLPASSEPRGPALPQEQEERRKLGEVAEGGGWGAAASAGVNDPLPPVIPSPGVPALAGGGGPQQGGRRREGGGAGGGASHTRRQLFRGSDLPAGPQDEPRSPHLPSSCSIWGWGSWGPAWKGQAGGV